jgi:hypothetical protein
VAQGAIWGYSPDNMYCAAQRDDVYAASAPRPAASTAPALAYVADALRSPGQLGAHASGGAATADAPPGAGATRAAGGGVGAEGAAAGVN